MIPRFRPPVDSGALFEVLRPGRRDAVRRYETAFARSVGMQYAVAFGYGRTAIRCFLESNEIYDREVVLPSYSCVVVAHAVMASGNRPVFVDSKPDDPNMDLDVAIEAITKETAVVIPTSLFGRPVDLRKIREIRRRRPDVLVLQDCCHSFGVSGHGQSVQEEGDAAVFALNFSKITTSVFGGMLTTNDPEMFRRFRDWREEHCTRSGFRRSMRRRAYVTAALPVFWSPVYGVTNWLINLGILDRFVRYFDESTIEMPPDHREDMSCFEAQVGLRSLQQVQDRIAERRQAAAIYIEKLGEFLDIDPGDLSEATFSHFILRHPDPASFIEAGRRQSVEYGRIVDYSIPDLPSYRRLGHGSSPYAVAHAKSMVNLPVAVSTREAERIASVTLEILRALDTTR